MFSSSEALRFPIITLKGWTVFLRCARCQREAMIDLKTHTRRDDPRVLAELIGKVRCRKCGSKPSAALLTNERQPLKAPGWVSKETRKGPLYVLLWGERNI